MRFLKCPNCGSEVVDGALSCPYCHLELGLTQKISLSSATWCPVCGALVPEGELVCPKCHSALEAEPVRVTRDIELPEIGDDEEEAESGETGVITRIESAIPTPGQGSSPGALRDRLPRVRAMMLAASFAVLVVGGSILLITHPWDPNATQTKATTPADTSMSGYPGSIDSLKGQDKETSTGTEGQTGGAILSSLTDAYDQLGSLSGRVDESEESLRSVGVSGDAEARSKGSESAAALSIEVSNLISSIQKTSDGEGFYADAKNNLLTLGNWLRNRCDALTESWELAADSDDPVADKDSILLPVDAAASFARLFEENYESWKPTQP